MKIEDIWVGGLLGLGAWLDLRFHRIPISLPLLLLISGLITGFWKGGFPDCLFGLLPGLLLLILSFLGWIGIGAGDGLLLMALGAWETAASVLTQFLAAALLAALWGLIRLVWKGKGLKKEYPFLPFLYFCFLGRLFL